MVAIDLRDLTVCAVVFLVSLAVAAVQVGLDLGTDTDAVADLDSLDVLADLDGLANDLVADANGERALAPAACVQIRLHCSSS